MDKVAREWMMTRDIIVTFLAELLPRYSREQHEHNAAAIIARLAANDPPLFIKTRPEDKEPS